MKRTALFILTVLFAFAAKAQFQPASIAFEGDVLPYQIMFPENYDASKQYPLIVFLHGAGERGSDNQAQLTHGKQFLIDNFYTDKQKEAIVIVPQCPQTSYWSNVLRNEINGKLELTFGLSDKPTATMQTLTTLVQYWVSSGKVDRSRVYAGGLSMGGMGTFELLWRMPNTFAAAFPICGGADINKLPLFANGTALWIFHGEADSVVPVAFSREISTRLKELGCDVRYSEYPGVNHNSWDNAFAEKGLSAWLFSHKK